MNNLDTNDIELMINIIVNCSEQGLIHPESMITVGQLYQKLKVIAENAKLGEKSE